MRCALEGYTRSPYARAEVRFFKTPTDRFVRNGLNDLKLNQAFAQQAQCPTTVSRWRGRASFCNQPGFILAGQTMHAHRLRAMLAREGSLNSLRDCRLSPKLYRPNRASVCLCRVSVTPTKTQLTLIASQQTLHSAKLPRRTP